MKCSSARRNLALSVGDDLSQLELADLRQHLSLCAACRQFSAGLSDSRQALDALRTGKPASGLSVWPKLQVRLVRDARKQVTRSYLRDGVAFAAILAVCLTVAVLPDWLMLGGAAQPVQPVRFNSDISTHPVGLSGETLELPTGQFERLYADPSWQKLDELSRSMATPVGF